MEVQVIFLMIGDANSNSSHKKYPVISKLLMIMIHFCCMCLLISKLLITMYLCYKLDFNVCYSNGSMLFPF